jgi:hypothetical protein
MIIINKEGNTSSQKLNHSSFKFSFSIKLRTVGSFWWTRVGYLGSNYARRGNVSWLIHPETSCDWDISPQLTIAPPIVMRTGSTRVYEPITRVHHAATACSCCVRQGNTCPSAHTGQGSPQTRPLITARWDITGILRHSQRHPWPQIGSQLEKQEEGSTVTASKVKISKAISVISRGGLTGRPTPQKHYFSLSGIQLC